MSIERFCDDEMTAEEFQENQESIDEKNISSKLERRRRIEELTEERRLKDELNYFDY